MRVPMRGYRVEEVNGERTEYVLEDGGWKEISEVEDNDVTVEVTAGSDEPVRATIDLSTKIGSRPKSVVDATFNNGILDVELEYESDD